MPPKRILQKTAALFITLLLWTYFLFGSVVFFFFLYLPAYLFSSNRAAAFQNLNHIHMQNFFALTRLLIPHTRFDIAREIRHIHSSVVVCNHLSYLDPILLISLLPRQCTIVKNTFFKVPFFGWLLKISGYIPSMPKEMLGPAMIKNLEEIKKHLAAGGNLFVFPEGTRNRNGGLAPFNKGVFGIARYCNAPLKMVYIGDTNKLFPPGSFLFNTSAFNIIKVELLGMVEPDYRSDNYSMSAVADECRKKFEDRIAQNLKNK
jgi:1-acyl-sn-glycerol-3-phosphate acyltransferase